MSGVEDRVEELLARLDLEAKVRLCTGANFWATWAEPKAGLRAMSLSDGPAGGRGATVVRLPFGGEELDA